MLATKPLLFKIISLTILAITLTSCADLTNPLTKSNVTDIELQSILLTSSDFPTFQIISTASDNITPEKIIGVKIKDKLCDKNNTLYSPLFINKENTLTSAAEPVCLGAEEAKEAIIKNFSELLYVREKMLNTSITSQGGNIKNIKTTLLEKSPYGKNSLTYRTTAEITFEDDSIPYRSVTVLLLSDQAAVSVILESYIESIPNEILFKAVTLSKSRLALIK